MRRPISRASSQRCAAQRCPGKRSGAKAHELRDLQGAVASSRNVPRTKAADEGRAIEIGGIKSIAPNHIRERGRTARPRIRPLPQPRIEAHDRERCPALKHARNARVAQVVKTYRYLRRFLGRFPGFLPRLDRTRRISVVHTGLELVAARPVALRRKYIVLGLSLGKSVRPQLQDLARWIVQRNRAPGAVPSDIDTKRGTVVGRCACAMSVQCIPSGPRQVCQLARELVRLSQLGSLHKCCRSLRPLPCT